MIIPRIMFMTTEHGRAYDRYGVWRLLEPEHGSYLGPDKLDWPASGGKSQPEEAKGARRNHGPIEGGYEIEEVSSVSKSWAVGGRDLSSGSRRLR